MKGLTHCILALVLGVMLFGCGNSAPASDFEKLLADYREKPFRFDTSLRAYVGGEPRLLGEFVAGDRRLVTYLDSIECSDCALKQLLLWRNFHSELEKRRIQVLFIIRTAQARPMLELFRRNHFEFPVLIDSAGIFRAHNPVSESSYLNTWLLDSGNRVEWIGSPVISEKSWDFFSEAFP